MTRENHLLQKLDEMADLSQLRRLSVVFARFAATIGNASPALILACTVLTELEGKGNSCLALADLENPCKLLEWTDDMWQALRAAAGPLPAGTAEWREALAQHTQIRAAGSADRQQPLVLDGDRLYLRRYWRDEQTVANAIKARAAVAQDIDTAAVRRWIDRLFPRPEAADGGVDWQKVACAIAVRSPLSIITGGPGTGKTYTVARLLALQFALAADPGRLRVVLAAPTGKAAARLKQSIDTALGGLAADMGDALPLAELTMRMGAARTLHSLLGARPDTRAFRYHAGNRLDVDVLIVDEASMVHLEMMAALLDALPPHATLVLLGDKDQLASVEAGSVLGDLCFGAEQGGYAEQTAHYIETASGQAIPPELRGNGGPLAQQTVMLRKSWRFGGPIGALALAINAGDTAAATAILHAQEDQILAWQENAGHAALLRIALDGRAGAEGGYRDYLKLILDEPPHAAPEQHERWVQGVLGTFEGFRILCGIRDGEWGVEGMNAAIAAHLEQAGLIHRRGEWYVGRPVIVTRNDYAVGVFNGDVGVTLRDPLRPESLRVYFLQGDGVRSVLASRLTSVEPAFAMTVHKSQGSEFRHTVMVLPPQAGPVVVRELIYTGITRASKRFTLVSPVAGVLNDALARMTRRTSGLRDFLSRPAQA
jgi:exodeoxyribonuclease V alpha subunit